MILKGELGGEDDGGESAIDVPLPSKETISKITLKYCNECLKKGHLDCIYCISCSTDLTNCTNDYHGGATHTLSVLNPEFVQIYFKVRYACPYCPE